MAGSNYERQSSLTNGITINASLFNSEFNQLLNAFRYSSTDSAATGHRHDGAAGQGANIYRVGDTDFKNKIEVDETNNRHGFFVEVGAAAVEQVRIQDGLVVPVTTNDIDLGSSSLEFKNIYARNFTSSTGVNANGGLTVALNTNLTVGTTLTMSSDGTDTTINEIGDGKLLVGANEYIFRTSDGSTSAVDATPTELNRMVLSSGDTGGVFIYGGNVSPVATDTGFVNHTAAFYSNGGLVLRSPASISNGGYFACQNSITITDVDGGTESFPDIHLKRNSPSPADADNLGSIEFWGNRTGETTAPSKYGQVRAQIENVSTGVGKIVLLPHDGTGAANAVGFSMGSFQYSGVDGAATNTKAGGVLRLTSADDTTLELSALDTNVFSMSGGLDVTGAITADSVSLGDNKYAQFGNSYDLQIFHNGTDSIIQDTGAGQLILNTTNGDGIYMQSAGDETMAQFVSNGAVNLYHDSDPKFATTATGIDVTGVVTADGLTLGAGEIATFNSGDGGNLQISGDATGSFSLIKQTAVGDLFIQAQNGHLRNDANQSLVAWDGFKAELYWRGASGAGAKLATTETGINVTGKVECKDTVAITTTGDGGDPAPDLDFINLHADAIGERLGQINYYGMNDESGSGSGQTKYAWTEVRTIDVTEDSEKAQHETWVKNGASHTRVLAVEPTGIDVTGTVAASDGLTADYIDLTGGESTTTTGTIACKMIVLNDSATDQSDGSTIFTEANSGGSNDSSLIIQQSDDAADYIKLRLGSGGAGTLVDVLTASTTGIDVTGTVTADGLDLGDTGVIRLGDQINGDLKIYHNGSHSYIADVGTGVLSIESDGENIALHDSANSRNMARFTVGGAASLNWAGGTGTGTKLETTATGIDVTGDLDVTGTITSNAFAHSKALVVETGSLSTSEFLAHAGKRIVKTGATTAVYSLPQPVAADIGKTWIIANASGTKATIDHDASGTAQNIWILDGVTLTAKEADWELKKGSITEIACVAAEAAGGSAAVANYIIYGAGVIEV